MKIYLLLLIPMFLFGQNLDWSDKSINYPDSLDDSTSIMYANPGERVFSADLNKMLRAIRVIQEKLGVLGSDSVLTRSETVDSINTYMGATNAVQYGATANDANEDRTAIQAAINSSYNHVIVGNSVADTFLLDQPLLLKSNSIFEIRGVLKVMAGDSGTLTANADSAGWYFITDDTADFAVGEYVGVTDTNQNNSYEVWRSWSGRIDSIKTDTIYLDNQSGYNYKIADNARFGHTNNALLLNNLTNVTIQGTGVIHGNRENQVQLRCVRGVGEAEQQRANCGISVWKCTDVWINDITVRNFMMHNIAITGENSGDNNNIHSNGVKTIWPNEKNYLIRFTDYVYLENCTVDSAEWEDGIMFYGNDRYCVVSNVALTNNYRYGLGWNSNDSEYLNAFNIVANDNVEFGIFVSAKNANISNVTTSDPIRIADTYQAWDINLSNINMIDVVAGDIFHVYGGVERLTVNNLNIKGCTGTGIHVQKLSGAVADRFKIVGGGISNHMLTNVTIDSAAASFDTTSFKIDIKDTAGLGQNSSVGAGGDNATYIDKNARATQDFTCDEIFIKFLYVETGDDDTVYVGAAYDSAGSWWGGNYIKLTPENTAFYNTYHAPDDFTAFNVDSGQVVAAYTPTNGAEITRSNDDAAADSMMYKTGVNIFDGSGHSLDNHATLADEHIQIQLRGYRR